MEAAVSLREGLIATATKAALDAAKSAGSNKAIGDAVRRQLDHLQEANAMGITQYAITDIQRDENGQPVMKRIKVDVPKEEDDQRAAAYPSRAAP